MNSLSLSLPRFVSPMVIALAVFSSGVRCPGLSADPASAEGARAGIVCHVKVLSDKVEDMSSLEAWKRAFIQPWMTDEQKALAIWHSVVKFQFQDQPPREFLQTEDLVLDPIKQANVYGYSFCTVASASIQSLARYAGLQARGWTLRGHVVPEIFWNGEWHLMDASLISYFPRADGVPASVAEIVAGIKDWYARNPGYEGNDGKLRGFMSNGGWRKGPEVLSHGPFYDDNGWLPAATHGWYSTMQEYCGNPLFPYEAGYSQGYGVNIQLREGEKITRNWSNQGLYANMDTDGPPAALTEKVGQGMLRYSPQYGDLAPGRIGNGTHVYDVPLADGGFRQGCLEASNLNCTADDGKSPALHLKDPSHSGSLVIRMTSSYVLLGGALIYKAVLGDGEDITVLFSENNGLDWKPAGKITASGEGSISLKPLVLRRYCYCLKLVLNGKGAGLDALKITHDIQNSQRPLPALTEGPNTITVSSDDEGTVTIEGSCSLHNKGKQILYSDFHPTTTNISDDLLRITSASGDVTFPISTPGDMTRLRIGAFYRARDKKDRWDVEVSFDGSKTYRVVEKLEGPTVGSGRYMVVADVPPGARAALVRLAGYQVNTTMLYNLRIDADYKEPYGGFAPFQVKYNWMEHGEPREDVHIVRSPDEVYHIYCATPPVMKSIILERPTGGG